MPLRPVCLILAVGLTPRLVGESTPNIAALAARGRVAPLKGVTPAVTATAQATMLTGETPAGHGIVGNGWFDRASGEVRFWRQSNRLLEAEPIYARARRLAVEAGETFTCAKLFWWFNQGAAVDWSVTPKPHYGADGSKAFDILSTPDDLAPELESALGRFPFPSFWGPMSGLPSTDWIADAAAHVMRTRRPTLTLVYLPHLDYDLQRVGPDDPSVPARLAELDAAVGRVIDAAEETGAVPIVVSEYGLVPARRAILINRALRQAGFLVVRDGPFGEQLDTFSSRAFAVVDHQIAHVYVRDEEDRAAVADLVGGLEGVASVLEGASRRVLRIDHERSGDLVALAAPDAWFAYPFWLDAARAPDYARTVDIHRKPGYDPCELFFDPKLSAPKLRVACKLFAKKLGFRTLLDVIPLDPTLVRGTHGVAPENPDDGPVLVVGEDDPFPTRPAMTGIARALLDMIGLRDAPR